MLKLIIFIIDYRIPLLDGPFSAIETPADAPQIFGEGDKPKSLSSSLRLANIQKKFIIALPQQQQSDCPLNCWITKEIFKESVELCISSSMTVNNSNDGLGNIIPSTLFTS
jgi:hypothetical protein